MMGDIFASIFEESNFAANSEERIFVLYISKLDPMIEILNAKTLASRREPHESLRHKHWER